MISPLAYVDPSAKLGKNVTVHPFAYIDTNVEIGDDNVIMPYASLMSGTRMGNGNTVYQGAVVAAVPQDFAFTGEETLAIIGNNNVIRENAVIIRGTHASHATKVGDGNFIMSGARLSHDVEVGNRCIIGNGSQVSGNCIIYDNAILTSNVLMQGNTRLGSFSVVQGGCRFIKDIPPYIVAAHEPIALIQRCWSIPVFLKPLSNTLHRHTVSFIRQILHCMMHWDVFVNRFLTDRKLKTLSSLWKLQN